MTHLRFTARRTRPLLIFLFWVLSAAVPARADEIDDAVKAAMNKQHIPAVCLAVIKDGVLLKSQAYGVANLEHGIPARPDTVYKIGSVSKQFIATGIMILVQDGKMAVDDSLSKYLPESPAAWREITLRHLLTHTSGLVREGPGFDPYSIQPDINVLKSAFSLPLQFKPGEKYEYSNLGYYALAEIIHRVSGRDWADFLDQRVFGPAGMTATRQTTVADIVPNRADGYMWDGNQFKNMDNWPTVRPSGAFLSTVNDMAKWEFALQTDGILKNSTKAEMWAPAVLNSGEKSPYGLGWQLDNFPSRIMREEWSGPLPARVPMIRHGGTIPGFRAYYARWPNHGLSVIVLTNLEDALLDGLVSQIAVHAVPELGRPAPLTGQ
jgi:D-alanyl-D-alanine carboxypeptidase